METLSVAPIVSASPDQVSGVLNGETILLSSTTNLYYGLDAVGSRVWELIQQPLHISAICDQVAAEFEVDRSVCEHDVRDLIEKLAEAGLVRLGRLNDPAANPPALQS